MKEPHIPGSDTLELSDKAYARLNEIFNEPADNHKPTPALVKLLGGRLKRPARVEPAPETPFAP